MNTGHARQLLTILNAKSDTIVEIMNDEGHPVGVWVREVWRCGWPMIVCCFAEDPCRRHRIQSRQKAEF